MVIIGCKQSYYHMPDNIDIIINVISKNFHAYAFELCHEIPRLTYNVVSGRRKIKVVHSCFHPVCDACVVKVKCECECKHVY